MTDMFDRQAASRILDDALSGADDGEIYVETSRSESFVFDDGRLKSAAFDTGQGFGLRVVSSPSSKANYLKQRIPSGSGLQTPSTRMPRTFQILLQTLLC